MIQEIYWMVDYLNNQLNCYTLVTGFMLLAWKLLWGRRLQEPNSYSRQQPWIVPPQLKVLKYGMRHQLMPLRASLWKYIPHTVATKPYNMAVTLWEATSLQAVRRIINFLGRIMEGCQSLQYSPVMTFTVFKKPFNSINKESMHAV